DVASRAIADPIEGAKFSAAVRPPAVAVVAETQAGAAIVFGFEGEVAVFGLAVQQVTLPTPVLRAAHWATFQAQGGNRVGAAPVQGGTGRGCWVERHPFAALQAALQHPTQYAALVGNRRFGQQR